MRFTNLLTLLAATSALALNFKRQDGTEALNELLQGTGGNEGDVVGCMEILAGITKCIPTEEDKTLEAQCKKIKSDECQTALKSDFSKCGGEEVGKQLEVVTTFDSYCATDESGKYCSFAEKLANDDKGGLTDKDFEEVCKSKKCSEALLNIVSKLKDSTTISSDDKAEAEGYIKTLNDDKCKSAHSGATQIKVGGALLATLALALYFF